MIEFTVNGKKYQARDLPLFDQIAVAKRLMPMLKNILTPEVMKAVIDAKAADGEGVEKKKLDWVSMLPAMADAIYSLKDEDAERIFRTVLKQVQRQEAGVWASVMEPRSGAMMFDDMNNVAGTTQVVWAVLEHHLGDFFSIAP